MEGLPMAQVAIFSIRSVRKKIWTVVFYSEQTSQRLTYIYYLATDNIHIVLENDNTVLIKGLKKVTNVNSQETRSYRNVLW